MIICVRACVRVFVQACMRSKENVGTNSMNEQAESFAKPVRVVQDTWSTRCYEEHAESFKRPSVTNEFLCKC